MLLRFDYAIERGDSRHALHLHAIVLFDGYCQLRIQTIKELLDRCMQPYSKGGYVNVSAFNDTVSLVDQYVKKSSNALIKS